VLGGGAGRVLPGSTIVALAAAHHRPHDRPRATTTQHETTQPGEEMLSFLAPRTTVHAHCDLPCGVYDPAQARLEAESVKACMVKYAASDDSDFRARAVSIKEERSDLVKHHLWVLWTDYFKAPHFEKYPQLNTLFNEATKLAGAGGTKGTNDVAVADSLLAKIDEIAEIFWETKAA
jgi:nickel superoxide dismutase